MKLEIEVCTALCSLSIFKINGIDADEDDFVNKYDHSPEIVEAHACGNMQADIISATDEVLTKYGISLEQYNEIAQEVSEKLSFGCCGWCV